MLYEQFVAKINEVELKLKKGIVTGKPYTIDTVKDGQVYFTDKSTHSIETVVESVLAGHACITNPSKLKPYIEAMEKGSAKQSFNPTALLAQKVKCRVLDSVYCKSSNIIYFLSAESCGENYIGLYSYNLKTDATACIDRVVNGSKLITYNGKFGDKVLLMAPTMVACNSAYEGLYLYELKKGTQLSEVSTLHLGLNNSQIMFVRRISARFMYVILQGELQGRFHQKILLVDLLKCSITDLYAGNCHMNVIQALVDNSYFFECSITNIKETSKELYIVFTLSFNTMSKPPKNFVIKAYRDYNYMSTINFK